MFLVEKRLHNISERMPPSQWLFIADVGLCPLLGIFSKPVVILSTSEMYVVEVKLHCDIILFRSEIPMRVISRHLASYCHVIKSRIACLRYHLNFAQDTMYKALQWSRHQNSRF